jgi:hypothetical protein
MRKFGAEHAEVADTLYYLGVVNHSQDKLDEAEHFFQRAIVVQINLLGIEHAKSLAMMMMSLASMSMMMSTRTMRDLVFNRIMQTMARCWRFWW